MILVCAISHKGSRRSYFFLISYLVRHTYCRFLSTLSLYIYLYVLYSNSSSTVATPPSFLSDTYACMVPILPQPENTFPFFLSSSYSFLISYLLFRFLSFPNESSAYENPKHLLLLTFIHTMQSSILSSFINCRGPSSCIFIASPLIKRSLLGVPSRESNSGPSRESNSGLPYSKPEYYQLSYAAPLLRYAAP